MPLPHELRACWRRTCRNDHRRGGPERAQHSLCRVARSAGRLGLRARQLRVVARLYLQRLPQTVDRRVRLVAGIRFARLCHCRHDRRRLLATARFPARSLSRPPHHAALHRGFRLRLRLTLFDDAASLASVCGVFRAGSCRERNGAARVVKGRDHVVSRASGRRSRRSDDRKFPSA